MEKWMTEIVGRMSLEDLPESYREIADVIGVEDAIRLSDIIGGVNYYFPKAENILRKKRNAIIREEFNGANHRALARKYRISETQVREIVALPKRK